MNEVFGELGGLVPNLNITGVGFFLDFLIILIGLFVLIIIAGIAGFFIYRAMKYNKKIIIFENINNVWAPSRNDKACEMKFGNSGDTIFYLLKAKKPIAKPMYQEGRNKYWMARVGDELIDFNIEDLDLKARIMSVKIPRQELLLNRFAIHEGLKNRFKDNTEWWKKHLGTMLAIILLLIFGIVIWLWFDKIIALSSVEQGNARAFGSLIDSMKNITENFNQIMVRFDNICTTSGISKS